METEETDTQKLIRSNDLELDLNIRRLERVEKLREHLFIRPIKAGKKEPLRASQINILRFFYNFGFSIRSIQNAAKLNYGTIYQICKGLSRNETPYQKPCFGLSYAKEHSYEGEPMHYYNLTVYKNGQDEKIVKAECFLPELELANIPLFRPCEGKEQIERFHEKHFGKEPFKINVEEHLMQD